MIDIYLSPTKIVKNSFSYSYVGGDHTLINFSLKDSELFDKIAQQKSDFYLRVPEKIIYGDQENILEYKFIECNIQALDKKTKSVVIFSYSNIYQNISEVRKCKIKNYLNGD